ncbi:hypothetical protein POPTR_009G092750v4 [Populus trichocarpa]|uniref:Uncharacterized protein n=1 Tax=Populus trichocarpa TaxID=3694 RepID=A0ACC0SHA5_POPTR|nr:hypothetical protein POPTR_009G092750v4 [Populus trichocarpa]
MIVKQKKEKTRLAELKLLGESRALSLVLGNRNMEIYSESSRDESGKWDKHWWGRRW